LFSALREKKARRYFFGVMWFVFAPTVSGLFFGTWGLWQREVLSSASVTEKVFLFFLISAATGSGLFPATMMSVFFYALFGLEGFFVSILSYFLALMTSFFLKSFFAKESLSEVFPEFKMFEKLLRESGTRIIFLCRISPILPFPAMNFALLSAGFPLLLYLRASMTGMLPRLFLTYMLLHASVSAWEVGKVSVETLLFALLGLAGFAGLWYEGRKIQKKLRSSS
jgi:uncharacterized membrane protein YdjX (TVP38/TMEM64 family)